MTTEEFNIDKALAYYLQEQNITPRFFCFGFDVKIGYCFDEFFGKYFCKNFVGTGNIYINNAEFFILLCNGYIILN